MFFLPTLNAPIKPASQLHPLNIPCSPILPQALCMCCDLCQPHSHPFSSPLGSLYPFLGLIPSLRSPSFTGASV